MWHFHIFNFLLFILILFVPIMNISFRDRVNSGYHPADCEGHQASYTVFWCQVYYSGWFVGWKGGWGDRRVSHYHYQGHGQSRIASQVRHLVLSTSINQPAIMHLSMLYVQHYRHLDVSVLQFSSNVVVLIYQ